LHTTTEAEDQVKSRLLLDVVVGKGATVLKLLAGEDQTLLVRGNALLVLNFRLDVVDSIAGLNLESDGLASDCRQRAVSRDVQSQIMRARWRAIQVIIPLARPLDKGVNVRVLTKICMMARDSRRFMLIEMGYVERVRCPGGRVMDGKGRGRRWLRGETEALCRKQWKDEGAS
jgi:hypothetical protein